jgi:hypothetical protein
MLGLWETDGGASVFPFTAFPEQFDAFETLENGTFAADSGVGLEAVVLGHEW